MRLTISGGILLRSAGKFLLGHCTISRKIPKVIDEKWGVIKGECDPHEIVLQTAIREFHEETSIDLNNKKYEQITKQYLNENSKPLITWKTSKKLNNLFWVDDKEGLIISDPNLKLQCSSLIYNPRTPWLEGLPEIDDFAWLTMDEAFARAFKNQKFMFTEEYIAKLE